MKIQVLGKKTTLCERATGLPLSPLVANCLMESCKRQNLHSSNHELKSWFRFVAIYLSFGYMEGKTRYVFKLDNWKQKCLHGNGKSRRSTVFRHLSQYFPLFKTKLKEHFSCRYDLRRKKQLVVQKKIGQMYKKN